MNTNGRTVELVAIAKIGRYRGTRGEVLIHPYFDLASESLGGIQIEISWPDGRSIETELSRLQQLSGKIVCQLKCSTSMADAKALVHGEILVRREDLRPLEDDEFFAGQLIGLTAVTTTGRKLGKITGFLVTGPSVLMQVDQEREYLIPFVREIVTEIDLERKKVTIDPPAGLLEINED